jgi:hypothetical protein
MLETTGATGSKSLKTAAVAFQSPLQTPQDMVLIGRWLPPATITGPLIFDGAEFSGARVIFVCAEFTGGNVVFEHAELTGSNITWDPFNPRASQRGPFSRSCPFGCLHESEQRLRARCMPWFLRIES